jgi:hypothetical protein
VEINKIINDEKLSIEEKSRAAEEKLSLLNVVITKLQRSSLTWLQDLVERMESLYLVQGDAAMQKAVGRLGMSAKEGKDAILEKLADMEQESDIAFTSYRIPDRFEAIQLHWEYVMPSFMYSLATDLFAPAMSLFFITFIAGFFKRPNMTRSLSKEEEQDGTTESEYRKPTDIDVAARLRQIHKRAQNGNGQSGRNDGDGRRPSSPN